MTVVVEQRKSTERNGYVLEHLCEVEAKSVTATVSECEKVEFEDGRLAVDWLSGSYLYGSEVQITYYTRKKPVIRQRVNGHNGYYRVEIHLSPDEAARVVRSLK